MQDDAPRRIVLVTDAWEPQVNGVVTTWRSVRRELELMGHDVHVIHPGLFRTMPCPRYPEIRLAVMPRRSLRSMLDGRSFDALHIATEGPLGLAARRWSLDRSCPFTTSFHTQFPKYLHAYAGIPVRWTHRALRRFHDPAEVTLVPTASMGRELEAEGYRHVRVWTRGVDGVTYRPKPRRRGERGPVFLYAGRVTREKNIEAFLEADLPGTRRVVGDGPMREKLAARHADIEFTGYLRGQALADAYAQADVFVFPSLTDTFGLVMLEAMACGTPVAAHPVTGPIDVVREGVSGCLRSSLQEAALAALELDRDEVRRYAEGFTWRRCADLLLSSLSPIAHRVAVAER